MPPLASSRGLQWCRCSINFGGVYPNHVFTATIFKAKQSLFAGVRDYEGKLVQVQGLVHLYKGKPEIVLSERAQIRLTT